MIRTGNHFDCVIVQRSLPSGNVFKITECVREIERKNRRMISAERTVSGRGVHRLIKRHAILCFCEVPECNTESLLAADVDGCVTYPIDEGVLLSLLRTAVLTHLTPLTHLHSSTSTSTPSTPLLNTTSPSTSTSFTSTSVSTTSSSFISATGSSPSSTPSSASSAYTNIVHTLQHVSTAKTFKLGPLGVVENTANSSAAVAQSMALRGSNSDTDSVINGFVQIDADTRIPYSIMDSSRNAAVRNENKAYFNLVVCNDLFETSERLMIYFSIIVAKCNGLQVLLWNYPGQANTEWREGQVLNNGYHASCLHVLLNQVGEKGTYDFDTSRPFYFMGVGNGMSIISYYAAHYQVPNMKGILSVNGWVYPDPHLAGTMTDCINAFNRTPINRPDLPVYFYTRFLFSKEYLSRISVPLALNLYTAVTNPITLVGRIGLCKGVLHSVDVRTLLKKVNVPLICVQSTQDVLVRPFHAHVLVHHRGVEVRSIYKALKDPTSTCVIWMKSGHELFQECKKSSQNLLEQILSGYFEKNDISFPTASAVDSSIEVDLDEKSKREWEREREEEGVQGEVSNAIEENEYLDNMSAATSTLVVASQLISQSTSRSHPSSLPSVVSISPTSATAHPSFSPFPSSSTPSFPTSSSSMSAYRRASPSLPSQENTHQMTPTNNTEMNNQSWTDYSAAVATLQLKPKGRQNTAKKKMKSTTVETDPSSARFQKEGPRSRSHGCDRLEAREYMSWRLRRNNRRLRRLHSAVTVIQRAYRVYRAGNIIRIMRCVKPIRIIQRAFRGWKGRMTYLSHVRAVECALHIQRVWKGYCMRRTYRIFLLQTAAAVIIQKYVRRHLGKKFVWSVWRVCETRYRAASVMQAMVRRAFARAGSERRRKERSACNCIQRTYRGHRGRNNANKARTQKDSYISSKYISQGKDLVGQMQPDDVPHSNRLQNDVTLLSQEKFILEDQVNIICNIKKCDTSCDCAI